MSRKWIRLARLPALLPIVLVAAFTAALASGTPAMNRIWAQLHIGGRLHVYR